MTEQEAKYQDYLEGHIGNVQQAVELFYELKIPFVVENIDRLRNIAGDHDKSKYDEPEWTPYLHHFYPANDKEKLETEAFDVACRHHVKNNKHHWEYWVNDDNELIIDDELDYKLHTVERCADWLAMAAQRNQKASSWYDVNKKDMIMPDYAFKLCDEIMHQIPDDYSDKLPYHQTRGKLDEGLSEFKIHTDEGTANLVEDNSFKVIRGSKGYLLEASMKKLKKKTLSEDPTRARKSKNVESKYIGISKYGVLNFETTSETHSGVKWYQEIHFPSFDGFMNIVDNGDRIEPEDVKRAMQSDNIKISCDDPSFLYWAWKYMAYRDQYGLEKETRAPKRNNTRLRGALCKHLYSVVELLNEKRIIDIICDDLNEFCLKKLGKENKGYFDPEGMMNKDYKANQYDWNVEDIYKDVLTKEQFEQYMDGTPIKDLDLTDEQLNKIDEYIKSARDSGQFELKSELEKQLGGPYKRGRKITRPDVKLQVGNSESEGEE